jgi:acyl-coenzyme A synthetase/AMP-(fatty) acid ligase
LTGARAVILRFDSVCTTLIRQATYAATQAGFGWKIPARFNIGVDMCDRLAETMPDDAGIIDVGDCRSSEYGILEFRSLSNVLANVFCADMAPGDRVGVLLPQQIETAVAHIATLKIGAIALPLLTQCRTEALLHRLVESGARVVATNAQDAALVLGSGHVASDLLADSSAQHVRDRLAPYEVPPMASFITVMPMTTPGRIISAQLRARLQEE